MGGAEVDADWAGMALYSCGAAETTTSCGAFVEGGVVDEEPEVLTLVVVEKPAGNEVRGVKALVGLFALREAAGAKRRAGDHPMAEVRVEIRPLCQGNLVLHMKERKFCALTCC